MRDLAHQVARDLFRARHGLFKWPEKYGDALGVACGSTSDLGFYARVREAERLRVMAREFVPPTLLVVLKLLGDDAEADNAAMFLARLGRDGRDYRAHCAICQTTDVIGTTCGCGHAEICVFRPCGHAMCAAPCARDFLQADATRCPTCKTRIADVIKAEESHLPEAVVDRVLSIWDTYVARVWKPDESVFSM